MGPGQQKESCSELNFTPENTPDSSERTFGNVWSIQNNKIFFKIHNLKKKQDTVFKGSDCIDSDFDALSAP